MGESQESRASLDALEQVLGSPPPPGVAALADGELAELLAVIAQARRRQTTELEASFHTTLKHIPFPLRGVVKKALLG